MKLKLTYGIYYAGKSTPCYLLDNDIFLCFDHLSSYFELGDRPKNIVIRLSEKEATNSYRVADNGPMRIVVTDSYGGLREFAVNRRVCNYLRELGGSAYVSVIA